MSVIHDEVVVRVRHTQLRPYSCKALTHSGFPPALRFNQWSPNGPRWFKGSVLPAWHNLYAITIGSVVALTRKAEESTQAAQIRN